MSEFKTKGMVQSSQMLEDITVLKKCGDNKYIVLTTRGTKCYAIFNCFTGLYYADDVYTIIKED